MIVIYSRFPGFIFHLPNKLRWAFEMSKMAFIPANFWSLSRINYFFFSFNFHGISSATDPSASVFLYFAHLILTAAQFQRRTIKQMPLLRMVKGTSQRTKQFWSWKDEHAALRLGTTYSWLHTWHNSSSNITWETSVQTTNLETISKENTT